MGIEVRNDLDPFLIGSAYYGLGASSRAEQERQRRQAQRQAADEQRAASMDALVAQLVQARAPQAQPVQPMLAPSRAPQRATGGRTGGSSRGSGLYNPSSGLMGALEQQMAGEQRMQQALLQAGLQQQRDAANQQADLDRQLQLAEFNAAAREAQGQQDDLPPWIQQGLVQGRLHYTPDQLTERRKLERSMFDAQRDRSLTPQQRMQHVANMRAEIRRLDMNPTPVSPSEWPTPLSEMFEQETFVDPEGRRWARGERNGVPQWTDISDTSREKLEIDRQKAEQQAANTRERFEFDREKQAQTIVQQEKLARIREQDQVVRAKIAARQKIVELKTDLIEARIAQAAAKQAEAAKPGSGHAALRDEQVKTLEEAIKQIEADLALFDDLSPVQEAQEDGPPDWYLALPSGATYTAPDGTQRVKP